jgi:N-acetyl-anhydromuramyl-L-alanine amidase AmpD
MTPGIEQNSHLVVLPNGTKRIYASPEQVTFHAGDSRLEGRDNVNDFSIGIEFQNAGNRYTDPRTGKTYAKPLTSEQVESAVEYIADILDTNGLKLKDIVTHKQIRDEYLNEYRGKRNKKGELIVNPKDERAKPDLDDYQYKQVIDALKARGYK